MSLFMKHLISIQSDLPTMLGIAKYNNSSLKVRGHFSKARVVSSRAAAGCLCTMRDSKVDPHLHLDVQLVSSHPFYSSCIRHLVPGSTGISGSSETSSLLSCCSLCTLSFQCSMRPAWKYIHTSLSNTGFKFMI